MITPLEEKLWAGAAKRSTQSDIDAAEMLGAADAVNLLYIHEKKVLLKEQDFKFGLPK